MVKKIRLPLYISKKKQISIAKWNAIANVNLINHINQEKLIRKQRF